MLEKYFVRPETVDRFHKACVDNVHLSSTQPADPEAAAVVRLRFLAGLSVDETAQALGVSARTVDRRWKFARAWLFRELSK